MNKDTSTASKFEFVDDLPPTRREKSALVAEFADALRANPSRWAKYPLAISEGATRSYAAFINTGNSRGPKDLISGEFEAKTTRGTLFVRFIGGVE